MTESSVPARYIREQVQFLEEFILKPLFLYVCDFALLD